MSPKMKDFFGTCVLWKPGEQKKALKKYKKEFARERRIERLIREAKQAGGIYENYGQSLQVRSNP